MTLIKSASDAVNYIRNLPELVNVIWAELGALDTRVGALDGDNDIELPMLQNQIQATLITFGTDGVAKAVAVSGDVTMAHTGAFTIAADSVEQSMMAENSVGSPELVDDSVGVDALDATTNTTVLRFANAVAEGTNTDVWEKVVGAAPFAGNITAVKYIPDAGFGQNTDTAALTLYNRGVGDAGTTAIASKNFTAANAIAARIAASLTLSGTPADVAVTAGQVLTLKKTNANGSAQIVPAGVLEVTIVRTV